MALQVWLPLNGDTLNQGLANWAFSNSNTTCITVDTSGKIGKCYNFNSTVANSGIYSGDNGFMNAYINNKSWTLCAWVNTTSADTIIISLSYGLRLFAGDATNTRIILYNSSRTITVSSGVAMNDGKWHHLAASYNVINNAISVYIDGILKGSGTYTSGYTYASSWSNGLYIGRDPNNNPVNDHYHFKGKMNDVRIYDHCLSAKEVKEISKGLVVHYKLYGYGNNNIVPGTSPNEAQYTYPSSSYSDKWSAITSIVPSASQYTLSFYAKSTVNGDKARAHWYSPNTTTKCESNQGTVTTASDGSIDVTLSTDWKKYWIVYTQSQTTAVKHLIFPRLWSGSGTGTVSVKYIKLEEGNKATTWKPNSGDALYTSLKYNDTTEYDCSGFKNNAIINGTLTASSDTARYSASTVFNQSGHLIDSTFNVDFTACTISFWVKPMTATSQHFILGTFSSWTGNGIGIYRDANAVIYQCIVKSSAESSYGRVVLTTAANAWNLFTLTYDGTTLKGYINGVGGASGSSVTYGSNGTIANPNLMIGNSKYSNTPASENEEAFISDFRIYATALSADDVKELYQASAHIDKNGNAYSYEFVEG